MFVCIFYKPFFSVVEVQDVTDAHALLESCDSANHTLTTTMPGFDQQNFVASSEELH